MSRHVRRERGSGGEQSPGPQTPAHRLSQRELRTVFSPQYSQLFTGGGSGSHEVQTYDRLLHNRCEAHQRSSVKFSFLFSVSPALRRLRLRAHQFRESQQRDSPVYT